MKPLFLVLGIRHGCVTVRGIRRDYMHVHLGVSAPYDHVDCRILPRDFLDFLESCVRSYRPIPISLTTPG